MNFGVSSMISPLLKVALMKPNNALLNANPNKWNYSDKFDPRKIENVFENFLALLRNDNIEIFWMDESKTDIADAIFTYDASLITPAGAVLMSPGKTLRFGEQNIHRKFYISNDIPIIGEIKGNGIAEAGDTLWLDRETLIIGKGFRTNEDGASQITEIMSKIGIKVYSFDLPVYQGKNACLHLMSLISILDDRKALIYSPLLPIGLYKLLLKKDFLLIDAPEQEFHHSNTLSTNVLATAPGNCIMIDGLPQTRNALVKEGINIRVFDGDALCIACEGGPTCLTRPLLRS
jgi:dimethylargininase